MLEDFLCSRLEELTDDIDESEDDSDHLPYEWENVRILIFFPVTYLRVCLNVSHYLFLRR